MRMGTHSPGSRPVRRTMTVRHLVGPSGLYPLNNYQLPGGASQLAALLLPSYSRYARSSRLAIRAPRSGIWYLFSGYRPG